MVDKAGDGTQARLQQLQTLELGGTYNLKPAEFLPLLRERGLKPVSCHFPWERWKNDPDAVAAEARDRAEIRASLAVQLGLALDNVDSRSVIDAHRWALNDPAAAAAWLGPYWRRLFADRLDCEAWRAVVRDLPSELRLPLTRVVPQPLARIGAAERPRHRMTRRTEATLPERRGHRGVNKGNSFV